jgi:hypothetical protein
MSVVTVLKRQLNFVVGRFRIRAAKEFFFLRRKDARSGAPLPASTYERQISRMTGIMRGLRLVLFWMYFFRSLRIFSLITP